MDRTDLEVLLTDPVRVAEHERDRRLQMLGKFHDQPDPDYYRWKQHAFEQHVPLKFLTDMHQAYLKGGTDVLLPKTVKLSKREQSTIVENYFRYIEPLHPEQNGINRGQMAEYADELDCSYRTVERWANRYQQGGFIALLAKHNPTIKAEPKPFPPDVSELGPKELNVANDRLRLLGELAQKSPVSNKEVSEQAREVGKSPRTLRTWWSDYRKYGLAGLAPRGRKDKDGRHKISDRMVKIVQGLRVQYKDASVNHVWGMATEKARQLGEEEPTLWQVRSILGKMRKMLLLKADGREGDFRNKYKITAEMVIDGTVYQIDHTQIDVLVIDNRSENRNKHGETRPFLTVTLEANSRCIVSARLAYEVPNSQMVGESLRRAFLDWGVPDEVWVDNGKDFTSNHIRGAADDVEFELKVLPKRNPQLKGRVERFFRTLNTKLWSRIPGYVDSNVEKRNPTVKAELTISEINKKLQAFIDEYHHMKHSSIDMSPIGFWNEYVFARPINASKLNILLQKRESRKVQKKGIVYQGVTYWHENLGQLIKQPVEIRMDGSVIGAPDTVEVYSSGRWICTAFNMRLFTREEIQSRLKQAQQLQSQTLSNEIKDLKNIVKEADQEIEAKKQLIIQSQPEDSEQETVEFMPDEFLDKDEEQSDELDYYDIFE